MFAISNRNTSARITSAKGASALGRATLLGGAALIALTSSQAAFAQTAKASAAPKAGDSDQVVVTARRREEQLERVPAAITAFGARQLEQQVIVSQADLQSAVPGLTMRETQGSNSLTYSIRGQTVDNFTGSATAVVPYFDEVQLVTGGASTFYDLESIQVLKGPQGTLFGRNATGGAVLFTSVKPKNEFGGFVKVRVGDYGMSEALGAVNLPIVADKVLLRISGDLNHRDGYQTNLFYNEKLGVVDRQSGRISLTLKPTEHLQNTTVVEADHSGGSSTANRLYAVNSTNCGTLNCVAAFAYNPATFFGAQAWTDYIAAHPNLDPLGLVHYFNNGAKGLSFYQANDASPVFHHEHDFSLVNTTQYDLSPDMYVKNIFGASKADVHDLGSSVGSPYLIFTSENLLTGELGNHTNQFTYSDEFQLQGKTLNKALTYIVGAYYQSATPDITYPQTYFSMLPDIPNSGANNVDSHFRIRDRTEAIYAQGTYDLGALGLKGFSFTGGYRYSWEQFSMQQLLGSEYFGAPDQSVDFSDPSWTAELSYQANDDLMFYAQGRGSWRSGGLNGTAPPLTPLVGAEGGGNLFKPERTTDVEIGAKFAGRIFDRPAHANVALYNQWITNVQRAEFPSPTPGTSIAVTINVPAAQVDGVELDASIRPTDWLDVGVSGALTDARFVNGKNTALIFNTLYVFNPYGDAPKESGSVYATVKLPTEPQWGPMTVRTELYGQSLMYFSNNNSTITPNTEIPGYGLVNMRYDWKRIMGTQASFAAYVKNLTDKDYYTGGFSLSSSLGVSSAAIGTPRMFGVELSYDF